MSVILWLKRDLRVTDNAALLAAGNTPLAPVFIAEPEIWSAPDMSARQWSFVSECLDELRQEFAALGAPLIVRVGDAVDVLSKLKQQTNATTIISHEETGNAATFARDQRVARWARDSKIEWRQIPAGGVVRRLANRDVWSKVRDARMAQPQFGPPKSLNAVAGIDPGAIPIAKELGLSPDCCPNRQAGGRSAALSLLGGFLTERGRTYRADMATPVKGETACSRLSPHLAWGTISGREAVQATAARQRDLRGTRDGWVGSLKSFQARLAWRDHFMQKLEDEPAIEMECMHHAYEGLRPREPDFARLHAWSVGETGLPFVDACMRYLIACGWLNFRMRSMLMAVASYHLWLDWRSTGSVMARYFTDYEPGIHWPQVQMQSGTTGMNTVRIYNPVKQGYDQDPTGVFTRTWVPELAHVPDECVQEPWRWDGAPSLLGRTYPEPIVDVAQTAKAAREAVWAVRRGDAFRAEAARVVEKHASRKDRQGRFVNDRAPRRKKPHNSNQLSLDL